MVDVIIYVGTGVLFVVMLYPFWELLVVSLMAPEEASAMGPKFWPSGISFVNYRKVLATRYIYIGYANTVIRTVPGIAVSIFMTFTLAYPLSKRSLPFRKGVTVLLAFTMFFSGGLIPTYLLVRG
ncbi:MAG: carbohydrate ABC transporter permease, partial [Spirochaetales bacterium]|nr:carbohydrate ABC transporter permease [Spirochaetales bacterium]